MLVGTEASAQTQQSAARSSSELAKVVDTIKHHQDVLRFFEKHPHLLKDPRFAAEARHQIKVHRAQLEAQERRVAAAKRARKARTLALVRVRSPKVVICRVFGEHCKEAIAVAQCESNLTTTASNGQYQGLFQMGSSERRLFGHGATASAQAAAAYRYFVRSGKDWSPWSCKPWW